jgi:hypothetical protein
VSDGYYLAEGLAADLALPKELGKLGGDRNIRGCLDNTVSFVSLSTSTVIMVVCSLVCAVWVVGESSAQAIIAEGGVPCICSRSNVRVILWNTITAEVPV